MNEEACYDNEQDVEIEILGNGYPQTKLRILGTCVSPIATYGCEKWIHLEKQPQKDF